MSGLTTTRCPGFQPVTEGWASAIVATASWPRMSAGLRRSLCPRKPWMSEPQIPEAWIARSASPGPSVGLATSWISTRPGPV